MGFTDRFTVSISVMPDERQGAHNPKGLLLNNTLTWVNRMGSTANLVHVADDWALKVQTRMRQRGRTKWKQRSGRAVEGLIATAERTQGGARVVATNEATEDEHHVYSRRSGKTYIYPGRGKRYGQFLELGMGGKYAVIAPTLHEMAPELRRMLKEAVEQTIKQ